MKNGYRNNFLWIDTGISLLGAIGFYVACNPEGAYPIPMETPTAFYQTLAILSGVLFGFIFITVPMSIGLNSHWKLATLKEPTLGVQINQLYFKTISALGLATLTALIGVFTSVDAPFWVAALNFGTFTLATARVIHCRNIMRKRVEIIEKPAAEETYAKMEEPS